VARISESPAWADGDYLLNRSAGLAENVPPNGRKVTIFFLFSLKGLAREKCRTLLAVLLIASRPLYTGIHIKDRDGDAVKQSFSFSRLSGQELR
jgi:hypothetical protein